jgi:hypothetical protein
LNDAQRAALRDGWNGSLSRHQGKEVNHE